MAGAADELGGDLAALTEQFKGNVEAEAEINTSVDSINDALAEPNSLEPEAEVDIPDSEFWASEDDFGLDLSGMEDGSQPESRISDEIEQKMPDKVGQILKYKGAGEELELDLSSDEGRAQAIEALEKYQGMQKAFAEKAELERQLKSLEANSGDLGKYKESWDKLEDMKHDRRALLEFLTDENYDDFIAKEIARKNAYDLGTEDEKRVMDYEDRIRKIEIESQREKSANERRVREAQQAEERAEEIRITTSMTNEFTKYAEAITHESPEFVNEMKKAMWQKSAGDLKGYAQKYGKITNKMVQKVFADNSKLFGGGVKKQIEKGVEKAIEDKKQKAVEHAQVASTKNYGSNIVDKDLASMSPDKLFKFFQKNRK